MLWFCYQPARAMWATKWSISSTKGLWFVDQLIHPDIIYRTTDTADKRHEPKAVFGQVQDRRSFPWKEFFLIFVMQPAALAALSILTWSWPKCDWRNWPENWNCNPVRLEEFILTQKRRPGSRPFVSRWQTYNGNKCRLTEAESPTPLLLLSRSFVFLPDFPIIFSTLFCK